MKHTNSLEIVSTVDSPSNGVYFSDTMSQKTLTTANLAPVLAYQDSSSVIALPKNILSPDPFAQGEEISLVQETPAGPTEEAATEPTPEPTTTATITFSVEDFPAGGIPTTDGTSSYRDLISITLQIKGASVSLVGIAFGIVREVEGLGEYNPPLKDFRLGEDRIEELAEADDIEEIILVEGEPFVDIDCVVVTFKFCCKMEHECKITFPEPLALVFGTAGDDEIFGDTENMSEDLFGEQIGEGQFIQAGAGKDTVYADAGDDIRENAMGGNDIVFLEGGDDTAYGDARDDIKDNGMGGDDFIVGGEGRDTIYADAGDDIKDHGKGGNDIIIGDGGTFDIVDGILTFIPDNDEGDPEDDSCDDTIYGDAGDDIKDWGVGGDDCIHAGKGDDTVYGDAGDDLKDCAKGGNDLILGGYGKDLIMGDAGDDIKDWAMGGNDKIDGGHGADKISGDAGDDIEDYAMGGDDHICAGKGDDYVVGDAFDDLKDYAMGGDDKIFGQHGNDTIIGDAGDDIKGHAKGGNDKLFGGDGCDSIIGDAGDDLGIWGRDPCEGNKCSKDWGNTRFNGQNHHAQHVVVMGGNDWMWGGDHGDWMAGDAGNDLGFFVTKHPDKLPPYREKPGEENDEAQRLNGGGDHGKDTFVVMGGDDHMWGGSGQDWMSGDAADNLGFFTLQYQYDHGEEKGGKHEHGNDHGKGGHGHGSKGALYIIKGGDDKMWGGHGNDDMAGDAGKDLGYFGNGSCGCDDKDGGSGESHNHHSHGGNTFIIKGGDDHMWGGEGKDWMSGDAGNDLGFFKNYYQYNVYSYQGGNNNGGKGGETYIIKGGDDHMWGGTGLFDTDYHGHDKMAGDAGNNLGYFGDGENCGCDDKDDEPPRRFNNNEGHSKSGNTFVIKGGDDKMWGGHGWDKMSGDAGNDLGYFENLIINALTLNSFESRNGGNNGHGHKSGDTYTIKGGNDSMSGDFGWDTMAGDAGNNLGYFAEVNINTLDGQNIQGGFSFNYGSGGNEIVISGGDDHMWGGTGFIDLDIFGWDTMSGDAGNDLGYFGANIPPTFAPSFNGPSWGYKCQGDEICIMGGNDKMWGGHGWDTMAGDAGNDLGYFEPPFIFDLNTRGGGHGHHAQGDLYVIKGGDDHMWGGTGSGFFDVDYFGKDKMSGDAGQDLGYFGADIQCLTNQLENANEESSRDQNHGGGSRNKYIIKGGNDKMWGGHAKDIMAGDAGRDLGFLTGSGGGACLVAATFMNTQGHGHGHTQSDLYVIKGGNDHMWGEYGDDVMSGDAGRDIVGFHIQLEREFNHGYDFFSYGKFDHHKDFKWDPHENAKFSIVKGGDDTMYGGDGKDTMSGDAGNDIIGFAFGGDDTMYGGNNNDKMYGDAQGNMSGFAIGGHDTMFGGDGDDKMFGDAGVMISYAIGGHDTLDGGAGDDLLVGDAAFMGILTIAGDDRLKGGLGNDTIYGDHIDGSGPGIEGVNTAVYMGHVCDYTFGWTMGGFTITDTNTADGMDEGTDRLHQIQKLEFNNDGTIVTYDVVLGTVNNDDPLVGSVFTQDLIIGFGGDDTMIGDLEAADFFPFVLAQDDVLIGAQGNDTLIGDVSFSLFSVISAGDDILNGGEGNDILVGDVQTNILSIVNTGEDTFVFDLDITDGTSDGNDTILDFEFGQDILKFTGVADLDELLDISQVVNDSGNAKLEFYLDENAGADASITFDNIAYGGQTEVTHLVADDVNQIVFA